VNIASLTWASAGKAGWMRAKLLHLIPALSLNVRDDGMTNLVAAPVSDTFSIVGTCINCTAPASLLATMTIIAIGVTLALRAELRSGRSRNA
jgi:hypothetical protein